MRAWGEWQQPTSKTLSHLQEHPKSSAAVVAGSHVQNNSYSPAMIRQNEAFTVICTYCNGGSASAGPFTMRISLNKGAETQDRHIASGLADATCENQDFDFAGAVGYEVTYSLEFDVNHEVQEFTTLNNKSAEANIILY